MPLDPDQLASPGHADGANPLVPAAVDQLTRVRDAVEAERQSAMTQGYIESSSFKQLLALVAELVPFLRSR